MARFDVYALKRGAALGVECQADRQVRFAGRSGMDLADRWQFDGHDEIGRRVIPKRPIPHAHAFTALQDHIDHRGIDRRQHVFGDLALDHGHAGDARFGTTVFSLGRERPEFIQLIVHAGHADGSTLRHASEKQKQAGLE